jgi:hypothetical protein
VLRDYRLVLFSSRGTGAGALHCSQLQQVMGDSELAVPPPNAVQACAQSTGEPGEVSDVGPAVAGHGDSEYVPGVAVLQFHAQHPAVGSCSGCRWTGSPRCAGRQESWGGRIGEGHPAARNLLASSAAMAASCSARSASSATISAVVGST